MIVGKLIKAYRQKHDLPMKYVAQAIGISTATLSRFESGRSIDGRTLKKVLNWIMLDLPSKKWREGL